MQKPKHGWSAIRPNTRTARSKELPSLENKKGPRRRHQKNNWKKLDVTPTACEFTKMSNFGDLGEAVRDLEKVLHAKPPLRPKRVNVGIGHKASHAARGSRISTLVASISSMAENMKRCLDRMNSSVHLRARAMFPRVSDAQAHTRRVRWCFARFSHRVEDSRPEFRLRGGFRLHCVVSTTRLHLIKGIQFDTSVRFFLFECSDNSSNA